MDGFRAEPFCTQLQAIGHNAHTTQGHGGPDEHRIEQKPGQRIEHASGDRHADQVVDKRPEKVLPNGAHGRGRKADRRGDLRQVGRKNRDLLHVDRNVAPLPMAMPRSACASAALSLMPSPTIATQRPWQRILLS